MPVDLTSSLRAGIHAEIKDTWRREFPVFEKQQALMIRRLPATKVRKAEYAFKETVPFPKMWDYTQGRVYQSFRDRFITLMKYPYEMTIAWQIYDEIDDLLNDLKEAIVGPAIKRYLQLPDILASEYLNGVVVMQQSLLNCYDGVALYSALDGDGNERLRAPGGNIINGSGPGISGVLHDFAIAQQRFLSFRDPTAGKPIFSPDDVTFDKMIAVGPLAMNETFFKASEAQLLRTDATSIGPESNIFQGKFNFHLNPYLTDALNWSIFLKHDYLKAFVYRGEETVQSIIADKSNSDRAREYNESAIHTDMRCRLGTWFPGVTIRINN